ncbi:Zinc carboxypeptidase [Micromonospora citrea]|uniref:Zinc carboxypeptidase n=1 Tax=Micromonospora citrea TaxID=47855 RepID=A0A1C6W3E1_9ACTN|nr:M14 family zinc carboxypeptidase [Micromonospora citrea]SCL73026.1 Zinc carboxypeptidase [Micromonospora citrea]
MPPPYPDITAPLRAQEIEDALADLAASFPALCTRTVFPTETAEGRTHSYVRIANGSGPNRPAALIVGGVHAREWAPPDALVALARNLLVSYTSGTDVVFPAMTVTPLAGAPVRYRAWRIPAADVNDIVTKLDLYVLPLLNPDGREHDLTHLSEPGWRKNRSPQAGGEIGVDLNRNFDIIWRFEDYYDVALYRARYGSDPASTSPAEDTYRGPSAHSEVETRHLESLLDTLPIHYYADVHMFGRNILYSWGLEEDGDDPAMHWRAPAFAGTRDGLIAGDPALPSGRTDYKEYLPDDPPHRIRSRARLIATAMHDEILRSAGVDPAAPASTTQRAHSEYTVGQSAFLYLPVGGGPNSGCSDDYACSRQFALPNRQPIFAYCLETGHAEEQGFHCNYADPPGHFRKINREIHAAVTALLKVAASAPLPAAGGGGGGGGCLIATAALGHPDHPDVRYLRHLRDERLRASPRGARIADTLDRVYYSFSPAVARWLRRHRRARTAVRVGLIRPLAATLRLFLGPRRTPAPSRTASAGEPPPSRTASAGEPSPSRTASAGAPPPSRTASAGAPPPGRTAAAAGPPGGRRDGTDPGGGS